jgi:hypothetical protein
VTHREHHPIPIEGCFGCKVSGVAFDGGHLTRSAVDEHRSTITEHRDGRQDVTVRPPRVRMRLAQTED